MINSQQIKQNQNDECNNTNPKNILRTKELTSVTLKTSALSLSGESLSHTYVGESFSIEPYVALT